MFNSFLNCTRLPLSRIFLGSLFHRVGPAQANARRPKCSKFTFGTSRSNPPAERSDRRGACWSSSAARYSGVPSYKALCTSTSSLYYITIFLYTQTQYSSFLVTRNGQNSIPKVILFLSTKSGITSEIIKISKQFKRFRKLHTKLYLVTCGII